MLAATQGLLEFFWGSFLLLAPMLLLGLLLAGLIHVLISREAILKWLSDDSLKSVVTSAAVGVPVPLCSCSVVPVVAEMRKKGASRSSCISFLITAPETGADSILVTNAFFGIVAAVVRPLVSFLTAVVTGVFCIGLIRADEGETDAGAFRGRHRADGPVAGCAHEECGHDHGGHRPLVAGTEDCYVRPADLGAMLSGWFGSLARRGKRLLGGAKAASSLRASPRLGDRIESDPPESVRPDEPRADTVGFARFIRHVFRYGFVEVADEILFALLVGVALGGFLFVGIPDGLMGSDNARWISYPVMVLVGIPLYICASASTPIAAALVAKGLSPGAALIFLMTGPATNSGSIAIIIRQFGARFGTIYVTGVIAVTTLLGIAIDAAVIALGVALPVNLAASETAAIQFVEWAGATVLIALMAWRFREGAFKSGYQDLVSNVAPAYRRIKRWGSSLVGSLPLPTGARSRRPRF